MLRVRPPFDDDDASGLLNWNTGAASAAAPTAFSAFSARRPAPLRRRSYPTASTRRSPSRSAPASAPRDVPRRREPPEDVPELPTRWFRSASTSRPRVGPSTRPSAVAAESRRECEVCDPEPRLELLPAPFAVGRRDAAPRGALRRLLRRLRPSSPPPGRIAGGGRPTPLRRHPKPRRSPRRTPSRSSRSPRRRRPCAEHPRWPCAPAERRGLCVRITRRPAGQPVGTPRPGVVANWRSSMTPSRAGCCDRRRSRGRRRPRTRRIGTRVRWRGCRPCQPLFAFSRDRPVDPAGRAPCRRPTRRAPTRTRRTVAPTSRASSESVRVVRSSARNRPLNLPALERYNVKNSAQPPAANGGRTTG